MRRIVSVSACLAVAAATLVGSAGAATDDTIAYAKGRKLFVKDADGSNKTRLNTVDKGKIACCVSIAPDGSRVLYLEIGKRDSRAGLRVVKTDGSGDRTVVPPKWEVGDYSWSPTSKRIAFSVYKSGRTGVYVSRANGRARKKIWDKPVGGSVSWNHDGTKLAFTNYKKGRGRIFYFDFDTNELYRVPPLTDAFDPEWSPTEDVFLFYSQPDPQVFEFDLYRIAADGTGEAKLSSAAESVGRAVWAPDGGTILYLATVNKRDKIFSIDSDGTNKVEVVADEDAPGVDSSLFLQPFAPDGSVFVYELYNFDPDSFDLLDSALKTSDLTGFDQEYVNDPDATFLGWSPDSTRFLVCFFDADVHSGESQIFEIASPGTSTVFGPGCDTDWDRRP